MGTGLMVHSLPFIFNSPYSESRHLFGKKMKKKPTRNVPAMRINYPRKIDTLNMSEYFAAHSLGLNSQERTLIL